MQSEDPRQKAKHLHSLNILSANLVNMNPNSQMNISRVSPTDGVNKLKVSSNALRIIRRKSQSPDADKSPTNTDHCDS